MNATTTIYTHGENTDSVISGFLGNLSAAQIAPDLNTEALAGTLLDHCQNVDPQSYAETSDDLEESGSNNTVSFTCQDIAERIVRMAKEELG